ncbi:hypothetical protein RKD37_008260 [Streptomyces ambofaciens]
MSAPHPMSYEAFVARATGDPDVVGLVLKGSHAHEGMATRYSDHDLYVVIADGAATGLAALDGFRSARLDLVVVTAAEFDRLGDWERYAIARARVLLDRLGGRITRTVAAKGRLGVAEASRRRRGSHPPGSTPTPTLTTGRSRTPGTGIRSPLGSTRRTASASCWTCCSPSTAGRAPTTSTWRGNWTASPSRDGTRVACWRRSEGSPGPLTWARSGSCSAGSRPWRARRGTRRRWTPGAATSS